MSDIVLIPISEFEQNQFFDEMYSKFLYRAVYGYLVEGLDLRQIEIHYLNNDKLQGFFSKAVLNYMGIDTSKSSRNKGRFFGRDIDAVVKELLSSDDLILSNIGRALGQYRLL